MELINGLSAAGLAGLSALWKALALLIVFGIVNKMVEIARGE